MLKYPSFSPEAIKARNDRQPRQGDPGWVSRAGQPRPKPTASSHAAEVIHEATNLAAEWAAAKAEPPRLLTPASSEWRQAASDALGAVEQLKQVGLSQPVTACHSPWAVVLSKIGEGAVIE